MKRVLAISKAWSQPFQTKWVPSKYDRTPDYEIWRARRVNDIVLLPNQAQAPPLENLFAPSELEIARMEFDRAMVESEREKGQMQDMISQLKLEAIIHEGQVKEVEKQRDRLKGDLVDLQKDYRQLRVTLKNMGLGRTPDEWRREAADLREEIKMWKERACRQQGKVKTLSQEFDAEKSFLQDEMARLQSKVEVLENSLLNRQNRIEDLTRTIANNDQDWLNRMRSSHLAIQERDRVMKKALDKIKAEARLMVAMGKEATVLKNEMVPGESENRRMLELLGAVEEMGDRARPLCLD